MGPRKNQATLRLRALTLAVLSALPVLAGANPLDPTVQAGQASFSASGNTLTITNAPGTVIDWRSFSIAQGEVTRFIQQSAASQVLNRVTGDLPSSIFGTLSSNGQVFLINPNGIAFGPNAVVDVAGLVLSSLNLSNQDFAAGKFGFSASLDRPGSIRVEDGAQLRASHGGSIYLIAPTVENHGVIQADGAVVLAAGKSATLVDTYRPDVRVELVAPENEAVNVGQIIGGHVGIYAGAIRQQGSVSASSAVVSDNGTVVFKASRVTTTTASRIEATGGTIRIEAGLLDHAGIASADGATGGRVEVSVNSLIQSGSFRANGTSGTGGSVSLRSQGTLLQTADALISASGTAGGGTVTIEGGTSSRVFTSGRIDVSSSAGMAGSIRVLGHDLVLAGATLDARGATGGGSVLVGGGARGQDASVRNANALYASLSTSIHVDATRSGHGGTIVMWSDTETRVGATLTARGGEFYGNGGSIEVSGKGSTVFGGAAPDAGASHGLTGSFLIDPKNIIVDDFNGGLSFRDLLDPNPNTDATKGNGYGKEIVVYSGNTLITDPYDNATGTRAGAIYLYRGSDGALLTALTGAQAEDSVGTGHRLQVGSNLLLVHTLYGSGNGTVENAKGAVTWLNPSTGKLSDGTGAGSVSAANSLLGSSAGDRVNLVRDGTIVTPVHGSGNGYFLISEAWNAERGAITWIDAATGKLADGSTGGTISAANSLVGENPGDRVGYMRGFGYPYYTYRPVVQQMGSGLVFFSPYFGSGGSDIASAKGAVTWINPATGKLVTGESGGVVSASNSLVGASPGDRVGVYEYGEAFLQSWNGSTALLVSEAFGEGRGAITWIDGNTGKLADGANMAGIVGAANSFVGSTPGDAENQRLEPTYNGFILLLPSWNRERGALTWIDMQTGRTPGGATAGAVGASISIVGGSDGDRIAHDVRRLRSGHFVSIAPDWDLDVEEQDVGAVTWISNAGTLGNGATAGFLSSATSLVGSNAGDRVGSHGIVEPYYYYVGNSFLVVSREWRSGGDPADARGAITWISAADGNTLAGSVGGIVGAGNSLVGGAAGDLIGTNPYNTGNDNSGVHVVNGQHYLVASPRHNGGRGAVTWISGSDGTLPNGSPAIGVVSSSNSLVGSTPDDPFAQRTGDEVGSYIDLLSNGHVLVRSPNWSIFDVADEAGAVTWLNGSTGRLVGMSTAADFTPTSSAVSSRNSLVGRNSFDHVGSGGIQHAYDYAIIRSPDAQDQGQVTYRGAITWIDTDTGLLSNMSSPVDFTENGGVLSPGNSLLDVGIAPEMVSFSSDHRFVINRDWSGGSGSVTWLGANGRLSDGTTGGLVSQANSLVGSSAGEGAGLTIRDLASGHALVFNPAWSRGGERVNAGAVTWINTSNGRLLSGATGGIASAANSVVGAAAGDRVGENGLQDVGYTPYSRAYLILSPGFGNGAGALTWIHADTGLLAGMTSPTGFDGTVSASNSLLGGMAGDRIGGGSMSVTHVDYYGPDYRMLISHTSANGGAGALTWMQGRTGALSTGALGGVISAANSVLGSAAGDAVGSGGLRNIGTPTGVPKYFILTPGWSDGGTKAGAGALTWIDGATGLLADGSTGGIVSSANSLVGSAAGDNLGSGGVQTVGTSFSDQRYVVLSPDWSDGGQKIRAGAVTWIRGSDGQLVDGEVGGVVGSGNSLVGGAAEDAIGSAGIRNVASGKYLVLSPNWSDGGTKTGAGAVTWFNGATGELISGAMKGVVGASNSLVGKAAGDQVGVGVIQNVSSGTLVFTPHWSDGGTKTQAGALTWIDASTGLLSGMTSADGFNGVVDANNSLVGANAGDLAGGYQWFPWAIRIASIDGTRYLVTTQNFASRAGAVTWMDMSTGRLSDGTTGGRIGIANSLIGERPDDQVGNNGSGILVTNSASGARNALILSPNWNSGTGAVTWIEGATGKFVDGTTGNVISRSNSLVGGAAGERVGQSYATGFVSGVGSVYAFYTSLWNDRRGAVTWMNGGSGLLANMTSAAGYDGAISAANSLVGDTSRDFVGGYGVQTYTNSAGKLVFVVRSPDWNGQRGAFTSIAGTDGKLIGGATGGSITAANSLIGVTGSDRIGEYNPQSVSGGNTLLVAPQFGNRRGSVTLMNRDWSITGAISAENSVIGGAENAGLLYQSSAGSVVSDSSNNNSLLRFSTEGAGRIVALSNAFVTGATPPQTFGSNASSDVTIRPQTIVSMLNNGTQVLLQANNDITIRKAILATGTTTSNGLLQMQAGRSIVINADVVNTNRNASGASIILIANELASAGVNTAQRDAGAAAISIANGVSVTGGGSVQMIVRDGSGLLDSSITAGVNSLITTLTGGLTLNAPTIGSAGSPLRVAAAGGVSATSTAGGAFLQQPQGSAAAGAFKVTVPDNQPLLLSVPNGKLSLSRDLSRAGSITLLASEVEIVDTSVFTQGTMTITASRLSVTSVREDTSIGGNQGTVLNIGRGGVTIRGSDTPTEAGASASLGSSGICTGTIDGDLVITGGSATGASAELFGSPDIGTASSPLRIGGRVIMTAGSGEGAYARVSADLPETIYLNFPNLTSGGYTVNGDPAVIGGNSGFFAGGAPAILGTNLFITYGSGPSSADVGTVGTVVTNSPVIAQQVVFQVLNPPVQISQIGTIPAPFLNLDDQWRARVQPQPEGMSQCR